MFLLVIMGVPFSFDRAPVPGAFKKSNLFSGDSVNLFLNLSSMQEKKWPLIFSLELIVVTQVLVCRSAALLSALSVSC